MAKRTCDNCCFGQRLYRVLSYIMRYDYTCICKRDGQIKKKTEGCEDWQSKEPVGYDLSVERLDGVIDDIKYLIENLQLT